MSYHDLSECTLNATERRSEASKICARLADFTEQMRQNEADFVARVSDESAPISIKQLFWLRDLSDKY